MKTSLKIVNNPITKIKCSKNDLAPISFYFDIIPFDLFDIPIMPIPMRIDKVTNGQPLLIIIPDHKKINKILNKSFLNVDFNQFFSHGLINLINYSRKKYKELTFQNLKNDTILKWFNKSINLKIKIPSLVDDFTYIFIAFIKLYSVIEKNNLDPSQETYITAIIKYCEIIIAYFQRKILRNKFQIIEGDKLKNVKIYKTKKGKYYPMIVSLNVFDQNKKKTKRMNFVPYLIYDDIIEVFTYNKKFLLENTNSVINIIQEYKNFFIRNYIKINKSPLDIKENNYNKKNVLNEVVLEVLL